jgi:hypothetical protein
MNIAYNNYQPQEIISNNIKKYTHKNHKEEIFVVDAVIISSTKSIVKCSFNNNHRHYNDVINVPYLLNPMLFLESCRQAETYIAHKLFFLDESIKFVLKSWSLNIIKENYKRFHRDNCKSFDIYVETSNVPSITSRLRENKYYFLIKIENAILAKVEFDVRYINGICYSNLRGKFSTSYYEYDIPRLDPKFVGYISLYNSILSNFEKCNGRWRALINVNPSNITYNDHVQDHITGMNIVEAAKQFCFCYLSKVLGVNNSQYQINALKSDYYLYVELSSYSYVCMEKVIKFNDSDYHFVLYIIQDEKIKAKCEIELTRFLYEK